MTTAIRAYYYLFYTLSQYFTLLLGLITVRGKMQTDQTYKTIRKSVETVQPGAKIAVQLRNDSKRESLQGEYVAMGDDMLLMVATMFTMNEGQKKKIVSVPFGSIKYIEFPEIEVPSE